MNMIFYQGDGDNIKTSLRDMSYNYMRSHHYLMFHLAKALGCMDVLDGVPGSFNKVLPGTEIYYTLKEFPEYTFRDATLMDFENSIGVLFHTHITPQNYTHLLRSIKKSKYLIYYCSDFEIDDSDYSGGRMLLKFVLENPMDSLSTSFRDKCILILSGFKDVADELENFGFLTKYIPQIINPNIPRLHSEKVYDIWMINTSPFYKHISDKLTKDGLKVLSLTRDKSFIENSDYIEMSRGGISIDFLLACVSMCKYYFGSYQDFSDLNMTERYSSWNHTSKILECYYSNTYWISSNKTYNQLFKLVKSDQYKRQEEFNKVIERDYSFKSYNDSFNSVVEICKQFIKEVH